MTLVDLYRDLDLLHRRLAEAAALAHAIDLAADDVVGGYRVSPGIHQIAGIVELASRRAEALR